LDGVTKSSETDAGRRVYDHTGEEVFYDTRGEHMCLLSIVYHCAAASSQRLKFHSAGDLMPGNPFSKIHNPKKNRDNEVVGRPHGAMIRSDPFGTVDLVLSICHLFALLAIC
jgi:hypothetical protein